MKTSPLPSLAMLGIFAATFFLSRSSVAGQYTYIPGTAALNVYFVNSGSVYPGEFDPTPDLISGPCTQVSPVHLNRGAELTGGFFFSSSVPGALGGNGSYYTGSLTVGTAAATVSFITYPFMVATNFVSQTSAAPGGQINLINTGSGIAELRLDWTAQFTYSGTAPIAPTANAVTSMNLGTWVAVGGGLTFYDVTTPSISSISIPIGGDYAIHGYPAALSAYSPAGMFWGFESPYSSGHISGNPTATGSTMSPAPGDVIETVGYLDLLVDPGSAEVTIVPAPQPHVQSADLSGTNLLVNLENCVAGVTYVTLRSSDVSAPLTNWQAVATNIANVTGTFAFTATNAINPGDNAAFFSFQAE